MPPIRRTRIHSTAVWRSRRRRWANALGSGRRRNRSGCNFGAFAHKGRRSALVAWSHPPNQIHQALYDNASASSAFATAPQPVDGIRRYRVDGVAQEQDPITDRLAQAGSNVTTTQRGQAHLPNLKMFQAPELSRTFTGREGGLAPAAPSLRNRSYEEEVATSH
jgi:hypothetical protein